MVGLPQRFGWMITFNKSYNLLTVHLLRLTVNSCLEGQSGKKCFVVTSGQTLLKILFLSVLHKAKQMLRNPVKFPKISFRHQPDKESRMVIRIIF